MDHVFGVGLGLGEGRAGGGVLVKLRLGGVGVEWVGGVLRGEEHEGVFGRVGGACDGLRLNGWRLRLWFFDRVRMWSGHWEWCW